MSVTIRTERFNKKHFILFFQKGTEDIGFNAGVSGFLEHMEWLCYTCEQTAINGKTGFVFPYSDSVKDVVAEAKAFIKEHNLNQ